jgi:nucleoside-diphosphate-sugar epimerase
MVTVNELAELICRVANKSLKINNIPGPMGVMARTSDNTLINEVLGWAPPDSLEKGLEVLYNWITLQLNAQT